MLAVRRRKAGGRRKETTAENGEAVKNDSAVTAEAGAPVQVDVTTVAQSGPAPADARQDGRDAARRVRIKTTEPRPRPGGPQPDEQDGGPGTGGIPPENRRSQGRDGAAGRGRRRPPRGRRREPEAQRTPTSPAEGPATSVDTPEPRTGDFKDLGTTTPSWLDEARGPDVQQHSHTVAESIGVSGDLPSAAPPRVQPPSLLRPAAGPRPRLEAGGEPSDAGRRRRRGRRGRRGSQKREPGLTAPSIPAGGPRPQRAPAAELTPEDEGLDDLDQDLLETELEITPFTARDPRSKTKLGRELIINVSPGFECRVAILHEGRLEELFIERESTQSHVGNIYKGRITNVEPSIQAAFVDFGLEKNGFLHISDVQPQYFPNHSGGAEDVGRKIPRHQRPPIQRCFRRGQEVIVQITKEGVGTKGPTLTSYLSIPGRFLVMMPGMSHTGVSRKIEDDDSRRRMRDILNQLVLPKGIGFILRTAGLDRPKRELQRDLNYLQRLWKTVVDRIKNQAAPAELYRESDLVIRSLRDVYTSDFSRIVVDDAPTARKVREFLRIAMPRTKVPIELYGDREPLFHRLSIEAEIERINMRHVPLPSGGSLVIDSTEAMVAIDVNSGRFRTLDDAEETALRINMEAAEEIARQLRLRDLGGLIVCDFIDMRHERNKRKVEQSLKDALKKHKERARTLRMSAFGLIEMTRQRQGPSIRRNLYHDCPHCRGSGQVKLPESVMLDAMRMLQLAAHQQHVHKITIALSPDVAYTLLNRKRDVLHAIEAETGKRVSITGNSAFLSDQMEILCEDSRGREVTIGAGREG